MCAEMPWMALIRRLCSMTIPFLFLVLLSSCFGNHAYAQCDNLDDNDQWNTQLEELVELIKIEDYDNAWHSARSLSAICSQSPILNYLMAKIAKGKKEPRNELYYYQKASEYTYEFAVEPHNAKKIWYSRYEAEHPQLSSQNFEIMKSQLQNLTSENQRLKALAEENKKTQREHKILLWSGVAAGVSGIVLASVGGAFIAQNIQKPIDLTPKRDGIETIHYKVHLDYITGWTLLGVGCALTLSGAILAGIYGYRSTHHQDYALSLSPMGASFQMSF